MEWRIGLRCTGRLSFFLHPSVRRFAPMTLGSPGCWRSQTALEVVMSSPRGGLPVGGGPCRADVSGGGLLRSRSLGRREGTTSAPMKGAEGHGRRSRSEPRQAPRRRGWGSGRLCGRPDDRSQHRGPGDHGPGGRWRGPGCAGVREGGSKLAPSVRTNWPRGCSNTEAAGIRMLPPQCNSCSWACAVGGRGSGRLRAEVRASCKPKVDAHGMPS